MPTDVIRTFPAPQGVMEPTLENLPPLLGEQPVDGGVELSFGEEEVDMPEEMTGDHYANLLDELTEEEQKELAEQVHDGFEADLESRARWEQGLANSISLLGLKNDEVNDPFPGASNVVHPLLLENCVKFEAKAIQELFPPDGPVKTKVVGKKTAPKEEQALRVKNFMNYQLTEEMEDYFDETERLLFHLAFAGMAFRKWYWDEDMGGACPEFVRADYFVVSHNVASLKKAERYTHLMHVTQNDFKRRVASELYSEVELGDPQEPQKSELNKKMDQARGFDDVSRLDKGGCYSFLEQHGFYDVGSLADENGLASPYVVTMDRESKKLLSIRRLWKQGDPKRRKRVFFSAWPLVPSDGFYAFGYSHLIGNLTRIASLAARNLIDAATFANLQAGFKTKGMKIVGSNGPLKPGEFRDVEVMNGMKLSENMYIVPFKEPSPTLMSMLEWIVGTGQKFADETDKVVSDSTNYGPVGTTLALLEASTKFFSSIHKRLHKALRSEFKILSSLNGEYLDDVYPYEMDEQTQTVRKADFDGRIDVLPVSDPNIPTQAHKLSLAQLTVTGATAAPQIHDVRTVYRQAYKAAGIENVDELVPPAPVPQPQDPVTDLQAAASGFPIKAFQGQDHDSHIAVKSAWLEDPLNGGNPVMEKVSPVVLANLREHMLLKYQEQLGGLIASGLTLKSAAEKILRANALAGMIEETDVDMMNAQTKRMDAETKREDLKMRAAKEGYSLGQKDRDLDIKEAGVRVQAASKGVELEVDVSEGQKDRDHEVELKDKDLEAAKQQADADRQMAKVEAEKDRTMQKQVLQQEQKFQGTEADKDRKFQGKEGQAERQTKVKVAKSKPKPKPAAKK